ncbi:MAG: beta-galactosidase trimerization domain-containing protein [Oscillospiraceae bacterium]|nr:beta-galactosidase trimerization domain-containing protein [Oscillospiraceae bacterium]
MRYRQVHLDFHTSEKIPGIGVRFDAAQFQKALQTGHVDSITLFSKCHHGWAYHPSKANEIHPHLNFDLLGEQIKAAHEIGVKTPVYLSVGLDEKLARRHPEWLRRNKDERFFWTGDFMSAGYHEFCLNTPYLDIVLSQVAEVVDNYDCDGIFLDIVGVRSCWCQFCVKSLTDINKDPRDIDAINQLGEEVYKNYYEKIKEVVNSRKPGLPIFQNSGHITKGRRDLAYANTHLELESLPTGGWGYDHFPASARYAETLSPKLEYLGMTGKFHTSWGEFGGYKHPNALRYETALSIANGAKCSVGDQLHPDAYMDERTYKLIGEAYREVEAKEKWCAGSENIADIAVFSVEANRLDLSQSHISGSVSDSGVSRLLLEGKYLYDIVDGEADISKYKLLILPDCISTNDKSAGKINDFIKSGGYVLASGETGLDKNLDLGVEVIGDCGYSPTYYIDNTDDDNKSPAVIYGRAWEYKLTENDGEYKKIACRVNSYFNRDMLNFSSHQHTPYNSDSRDYGVVRHGNIIYCGWEIFSEYANYGSITTKELVFAMLEDLIGGIKTVKTNLGAQGIITLRKQKQESENDNRYIVHSLYASPVKRGKGIEIIEDLPYIYDTKIEVRTEKAPKKVTLEPQGEEIAFEYKDGILSYNIEKFECHQMSVIYF